MQDKFKSLTVKLNVDLRYDKNNNLKAGQM